MEKYRNNDPEFVEKFLESIYVDDLNAGDENDDKAFVLYKKSKLRLAEGGFNLRKFFSNSPTLMNRINENEAQLLADCRDEPDTLQTSECINQDESKSSQTSRIEHDQSYTRETTGNLSEPVEKCEQKILGVRWNYQEDCFVFDLGPIAQAARGCEPTKRNIISIASKFYDPLGFISPIIVQMKLLFQSLCDSGIEWDAPVTGELKSKWLKLVDDLQETKPMTLPRCYFVHIKEKVLARQLHGFCDASMAAYAAVVYLVVTTTTRRYATFVTAKTRVAPCQKQTIPRLELLSAVILARLIKNTYEALKSVLELDENVVCWTDSLVSLYWIRGETKEWKQFVQLRVNEIRRLICSSSWRHCPGVDNPADIPTRSIKCSELGQCELWRNGPPWLSEELQPNDELIDEHSPSEECLREMKKKPHHSPTALLTEATDQGIKELMNVATFSNYHRLLRVTVYVRRFVRKLKANVKRRADKSREGSKNSWMEEINEAETLWLKEMQTLLTGHPKYQDWRQQFGTFVDEKGIIRCGGRLENANIDESAKHPVLLDPRHQLTRLIVRYCHRRVKHCGTKATLTELRSRFWIVRGRQYIRNIIYQCVVCRKHEGKPYCAPPPPPLPECRVKEDFPFAKTGVDFAGPLYVKNPDSKVWISLYTCCVTRAVHLDLVPDMSTEAFLRNFQRFCARRGLPSLIISDNAKTFKSASRKLTSLFESPRIINHLTSSKIKWSFILEKAPWWGGFYERMIKSVKRCLRKTLGNARLTYEELLTELVEIEAILNSRPLTYTSTEDWEEPVTPSHLMHGRRLLSLPTQDGEKDRNWEPTSTDIAKRERHLASLLDHFWRRWKTEYLLELRQAHRARKSEQANKELIKVNDIVIVHDENRSRSLWRLGRVMHLVRGNDGKVRGAKVKVAERGKKPTTLRRPIQKLYPIEIGNEKITQQKDDVDTTTIQPQKEESTTQRPRREAAIKATEKRRELIRNEQL